MSHSTETVNLGVSHCLQIKYIAIQTYCFIMFVIQLNNINQYLAVIVEYPNKIYRGGIQSMDGKYVNTVTFCNAKPTLHHLINLKFCVCMLSSLSIYIKRSFENYLWSNGQKHIKENVTCSGQQKISRMQ